MTPPSPAVTLRTADPADREAVIDLIQALNVFEDGITGDRRQDRAAAAACYARMAERVAAGRGRIVLAVGDERVVGAMAFAIEEDQPFVRDGVRVHGVVTDLVVAEAYRGHGIGTRLLAEAERLTREAGLGRLAIAVLAGNAGARRAYARFGFADYAHTLVKALGPDG